MSKNQYGLSDSGFSVPNFGTIKSEIESSMVAQIGAVNFEVPSILGVLTTIAAERELTIWEQVQNIYNSFFIDTATAGSLDYVVASNLLSRLKPSYTKVKCQLSGTNFTNIIAGSQALLANTDIVFTIDQNITISNENCYSIDLTISDATQANYTITINNTPIIYTKIEGDTVTTILAGLMALINSGSYNVNASLAADTLTIITSDMDVSFMCHVSIGVDIALVTSSAIFICNQTGSVVVPSHTLNNIQTPIQGWVSIDNITAGATGRNLETDIELRQRQQNSLNIEAVATDPAIQARVLQVAGVTSVQVVSDRVNHTISTIVLGGEDNAVASMLQLVRPAGIQLIGNTEVSVTDQTGTYIINFTRPDKMYIFVEINLTVNSNFLPASIPEIKNLIVNYINALGVNNTVIYQALYAFIYSVSGVTAATVLIGGTLDQSVIPTLNPANIAITDNRIPFIESTFITITTSP